MPNEKPAHSTDGGLPHYQMARLPITCAEWRAFVRAGGYDPLAPHWQQAGVAAQAWLQNSLAGRADTRQARWPLAFDDADWCNGLNPITSVSAFAAVAYAAWASRMYKTEAIAISVLTPEGRWQTRLPSEVEWEAAMRVEFTGLASNRTLGVSEQAGPLSFNHDRTGWYRPSSVGVFSADYGPAGQADWRGNVWERCCNSLPAGPVPYDRSRECVSARWDGEDIESVRALRGGAYYNSASRCRLAFRHAGRPERQNKTIGFRLLRSWVID